MSRQSIDFSSVLDILLNEINENPVKNYEDAILNLLKSLEKFLETNLSSTTNFLQTFSSLKIVLKLLEKQCALNEKNVVFSSFNITFKGLNDILNCDQENLLSNNQFQKDLLQIVISLCGLALDQGSEGIQELIKFYSDNLNQLIIFKTFHEILKISCILKLKIIGALYEATSCSSSASIFKNELTKLELKEKECKLFSYYLLDSHEDVAIQTLLFVVPLYMNFMKTSDLIRHIWSEISTRLKLETGSVNQRRIMITLCHLFDFCSQNNEFNQCLIMFYNDGFYWNLIQFGLTEKDPILRKQSMYLLKNSINHCRDSETNCHSFFKGKQIFSWESSLKEKLYQSYSELISVLEFLDAQQIHIIKPIFEKADDLIRYNFLNLIDYSWTLVLYKKALMHESNQVVEWGLNSLVMLPEQFFAEDHIVTNLIPALVPALNNISLYYTDGLGISKSLKIFFRKIMNLEIGNVFFNLLIETLCSLNWSPQALFFVILPLADEETLFFWTEKEILVVQRFVRKAFETFDETFSTGMLYLLLKSFIRLNDKVIVPLECILLFFESFSGLPFDSTVFKEVIDWVKFTYTKEDAKEIVEKFKNSRLSKKLNDKCIANMFVLFHLAFDDFTNKEDGFVRATLFQVLLSFQNIDKRVYCDTKIHNNHLSIVCNVLENAPRSIVQFLQPFFENIIDYILLQIKLLSSLKDFEAGKLYVRTFQHILNTDYCDKKLHYFYLVVFNMFEVYLKEPDSLPSIQILFLMKFLSLSLKDFHKFGSREQHKMLVMFLVKNVNESLRKDQSSLESTRDFQVLWGKMNSEFLESKWKILNYFLSNQEFVSIDSNKKSLQNELGKLCSEALNIGGYGVLCPVMSVLKKVIPEWNVESDSFTLIDLLWNVIMERRKSEEFQQFISMFVQMLFQEEVFTRSECLKNKMFEYADLIFLDSSLTAVDIFVRHVLEKPITENMIPLFCKILGKALLFGSVQRKDERLSSQVCSFIQENLKISVSRRITANDVRVRAIEKIRKLNKESSTDIKFAENLVVTLMEMEKESTKNKVRYFGDSHIHRVKHRLMQALLLLEHFLYPNQEIAETLTKWLYQSLMKENPQPSVKYQQEWLLIRILIKYEKYLIQFWDYFDDSSEKKTKGLCSLISMSYHLCVLVSSDSTSSCIDNAITTLLPFCMDQHFEVRLYSQVVMEKLYTLAINRNLTEIVVKYKMIKESILESIKRGCKGNMAKNCLKLQEDFYLTVFHPFKHYSLQTIYWDLPRLSNVGRDEWISVEKFLEFNVGNGENKIHLIPINNDEKSLESIDSVKWLVEKSHQGVSESEELLCQTKVENYQKKMIPTKPLLPEWEKPRESENKDCVKDGLIVVASLIDRIPNLGGLARTCEIFGASEYVISSLKYIVDKQFTSLSVTAEKWIPIKEVKIQNLLEYLIEMKQVGYTIIGAEQALYSQPLSNVKFPKKSLLLLGNEKKGIPPNLLPFLDFCVEIPQVGIIRSLNVHVTGALFIWEYAKQNFFSSS